MINNTDKISFLKTVDLFADLPLYVLEKLAEQMTPIYLQSGDLLIQQGDKGDSLYIVISGRLRATRADKDKEIILGEIGRGELIGEVALLTGATRTASVTAIRDSVILKLSQVSFEAFISESPLSVMPIIKTTILRLLNPKKKGQNIPSTIAIVPAANNQMHKYFAQLIAAEFSKSYKTLYLDQDIIQAFFKKNNIKDNDDGTINPVLINWLNQQEQEHKFIIYVTDQKDSSWTQRCLRQADYILLVGEDTNDRNLNEIEKQIFKQKTTKKVDLVIVHPESLLCPTDTVSWLKDRKISNVHHIKNKSLPHLQRIVRFLTGKNVALVLNGAGARGLAHIGVLKAFDELKIPIDSLAGVSFGAIVACIIAQGLTYEEILDKFQTFVMSKKQLFYYTIPFLSITAGHSITSGLKTGFGEETYIEDLWKNFFCVASNLTRGDIEIISSGLVWRAIRASVSLPAIFPPITNEKNELLIDGGIMNNFPVDIMRSRLNGGIVIGSRVSTVQIPRADIPEGVVSGWRLLFQKLTSKDSPYPNIADIIIKTIGLSSLSHENKMMTEADCFINIEAKEYSLFDFKRISDLIDIGYHATMEKSDNLKKLVE